MKHDTQKEIGELIEEITAKGWEEICIDVDDSSRTDGRWVLVSASLGLGLDYFESVKPSIVEALGEIADDIRCHLGQPTRAEELDAMLAADASHAAAPPVNIGPDARCGCGSQKSLIVERLMRYEVDWCDGMIHPLDFDEPTVMPVFPKPGEIGTCPDCGRNYTFGPA